MLIVTLQPSGFTFAAHTMTEVREWGASHAERHGHGLAEVVDWYDMVLDNRTGRYRPFRENGLRRQTVNL